MAAFFGFPGYHKTRRIKTFTLETLGRTTLAAFLTGEATTVSSSLDSLAYTGLALFRVGELERAARLIGEPDCFL